MPQASDGAGPGAVSWRDGGGNFTMIPEWVLYGDLSDRAVRLYGVLGRYADGHGKAFPGKAKLMRDIRCSRPSLDEALKELVAYGALDVTARFREDGGQTTNDYVLAWTQVRPPSEKLKTGTPPQKAAPGGNDLGGQELEPLVQEPVGKEKTPTPAAPEPPKLPLIDGRNLPLDALLQVCEIDPANTVRVREAATALNGTKRDPGILALFWTEYQRWVARNREVSVEWPASDRPGQTLDTEALTRALVATISIKANLYRQRFEDAELTPHALRKWWLDLRPREGGTVSGDDLRAGRA